MKQNKTLLATIPLCFVPSCLSGCRGTGDRILEIEVMGNKVAIRDTVPLNEEGKKEFSREFDIPQVTALWDLVFGDDGDGGDQSETPQP